MTDYLKKPPTREMPLGTDVNTAIENCVLYVHDVEQDGVVVDCESKPAFKCNVHIWIDFSASTNLRLTVPEGTGVEQPLKLVCEFVIKAGEFKRLFRELLLH